MKAIIFLIAFVVFIFLKSAAYAVSLNIVNYPSSISADTFSLTFSVSGASDGQNYFRADLFKEGTSNYFGETYNGSAWYFGSDGKQYLPVNIISSTASASLQVRLGSPGVSDYLGPGNYKLKIRRYTSSGNASSSDVQTPVDIVVNYSTPTLTPTPSNAPTLTPTLTITPSPTIPPTLTPTLSPTKKPTATYTPTIMPSEGVVKEVLGSSENNLQTPTATSQDKVSNATFNIANWIGFIFIIIGVIFLCLCGILFFWPMLKIKFTKNE